MAPTRRARPGPAPRGGGVEAEAHHAVHEGAGVVRRALGTPGG